MNILAYFIQSQVILLVFYLLYIKILHKKINFSFSRAYLLVITPISFILPLVNIPIGVEFYQSFSSYLPEILVTADEKSKVFNAFSISDYTIDLFAILIYLVGFVYFIGFVFTLYKLGIYIKQSFKILKGSKRATINGKEIIISPNKAGAFSLLGKIIIGEYSLNNAGISHIIRHEELHCRLFHYFDIIFIFIQKAFLWFNPIVWHLEILLREVHEFQVDEGVIKLGISPKEYSGLLLNFEMGIEEPIIANRFGYLSLKNRIIVIANAGKAKSNMRVLLIFPIVLYFITIFCIVPTGCSNNATDKVEMAKEEIPEISFALCHVKPTFNGGDQNNFTKWVFEQIQYPKEAQRDSVQGRVTLQFTIDEHGKVCNVAVVKGVNEFLDKEALRVVSSSPDWEPGKDEKGSPVKIRFTFPVIFQLR